MLQFVRGLSSPEKTDYLIEELQKRVAQKEMTYLLVPEQVNMETSREMLERFGVGAQRFLRVMSFSDLCHKVLSFLGPLRMRYIDGAGKQILAAHTVEKMQGGMTVMNRTLRQSGFSAVLLDTISEMKRYGISPQALSFVAEKTEDKDLSEKLTDLSLLYGVYQNLLEEHHADAEDDPELVGKRIPFCDFLEGKLFVLYFRTFTPVEQNLLIQLMHRMDVCICTEESQSPKFGTLFQPIWDGISRIKQAAKEEEIPIAEDVTVADPIPKTGLEYLRSAYFHLRAEPWQGSSEQVTVVETQNIFREAEEAANLILRLCRTENRRFSDFLILARNAGAYDRILPAVFGRKGVSVFLDARRGLGEKPLMQLLCGTLEILAYGYSCARMMTIARSGLTEVSREEADRFENYVLMTAPSYGQWQAENWSLQPKNGDFDLEEINRVRNSLSEGVHYVAQKITGVKSGAEIATAILEWMNEGYLLRTVAESIREQADSGEVFLAKESRQVWAGVQSVLSQIAGTMTDEPMTYKRFLEVFRGACESIDVGLTPQTADSVSFGQIDRFRTAGKPVVLVLGLNDGEFPKGFQHEGLISDRERQTLRSMGVELAPDREGKRREEQLLIDAILSAATERLYLFRPCAKSNGEELLPSPVIERAKELLPDMTVYRPGEDGDLLSGGEGRESAFDLLAAELAKNGGDAGKLSEPLQELYRWFAEREPYGALLRRLEQAICAPEPKAISPEVAEELYGKPLRLSASQLEKYNKCAFQYFMTYGLLLRERETAELDARSTGSIQHDALCRYFTDLKEKQADYDAITRESCYAEIGKAVEDAAKKNAELLYAASGVYRYTVLRMKEIAARTAWEVIKFYRSSDFRPYGYEIRIGTGGDIPELSVRRANGEELARVRGFVDRADVAVRGGKTILNIVDYKSSEKTLGEDAVERGITIQPLLYTAALKNAIPGAVPGAMTYLQMTDPILAEKDLVKKSPEEAAHGKMQPKGWISGDGDVLAAYEKTAEYGSFMPQKDPMSAEEMERRIAAANERIRENAEEILGGNIKAEPYITPKEDSCAFCAFGNICGKNSI